MRWIALLIVMAASAAPRSPMQVVTQDSAYHSWLNKKVHASRLIDDKERRDAWALLGNGKMSFQDGARKALRVEVALQGRKTLPSATARRVIANEDWRGFNRVSFWARTEVSGFPVITLMVTVHNAGKPPVAEVHEREATEHVTLPNGRWTHVVWEIPHIERDRVTYIEFRPWVNKRLADPWDSVAFEIGPVELQRVDADHYEGWKVAPGEIAFSHSGYPTYGVKSALATGLKTSEFQVLRAAGGAPVLRKKIALRNTRLGAFQELDFSELRTPGTYILRAGDVRTRPFRIGEDVWAASLAKTVNFFFGERCGVDVAGLHEACHRDWLAVCGDKSVVMNGGWHDAGDLSQGLVHTGEATYSMFKLAAAMRESGRHKELLPELLEEARWGLDWVHKVRLEGGHRVGFANMNIWTNGIIGDADDRTVTALNNPNVNYIAAAAGAAAYSYLKDSNAELANKSLAIAEDDWRHAITGVESPATLHTPAYAATEMELASVGVIASVELYKATRRDEYARKALELSRVVVASQHREYAGSTFRLAGFFYTGPDRQRIFHQFHRANDQAPVVALSMLCDAFPDHDDWMKWYTAATLYAEYQKRAAQATAPYGVLPAYVYRDDEWQSIAEGDRYGSSRASYKEQVLAGMPMGGGYYLRAFPVWFTRRGNYGVLLSETKALSAAARLRGDRQAAALVQTQLQWVVGRNPFCQSTMWGEGYDFVPQYTVSVGDIVGSLPVGVMTLGAKDAPYWPATNSYVYKEVWVHSSARWLSILEDVVARRPREPFDFKVSHKVGASGEITITVEATGNGKHKFRLRGDNLLVQNAERELVLPGKFTWTARAASADAPWVAVIDADGHSSHRRDLVGY